MVLVLIGIIVSIFIINVVPAFMPPTWMLLSFIGYNFHLSNYHLAILAILAAVAATSGRIVLALFSKKVIRNKILGENTRQNIDVLKQNLEKGKFFASSFFALYALSPLPSGQLFLAYGLTDLKLIIAVIPFFIGRIISYLFWPIQLQKCLKELL